MKQIEINCRNCRHFYITWEQNFPYGCKAIGFKSRKLPSIEVKQTSGINCTKFSPKISRSSTN